MDEQIERFLNYIYRKNSQSERTIESYKQDLEQFKQYLSSESIESFDDVTRNVMLNYIVSLDDLKSSSIARKLSTYRSFYAYLNEYMGIPNNPMTQIKGPKIDKKIPDFLFPEEIGFFLETYDDAKPNEYRDRMLFTLMYASGLRVSEICQLTWSSVDLDDRVLHIIGKGDKARIVPFFKGLESELSNYKKTYWAKYAKDETVFVNNHGKALTIRGVYYLMNKHAQNIGMDMKLHPHMLRHSFATHLLDNGADIRVVQELLGHASLSTTQIYTHVSLNQLKKAYHDAHPLEKRVETKH